MEGTFQITAALKHREFAKHLAVLTDARFSGVSGGACIGRVSQETLAGGRSARREGDQIEIIVDRKRLEGSVDLAGPGGWRRARSGAAGRHAVVGGSAGCQRRHVDLILRVIEAGKHALAGGGL